MTTQLRSTTNLIVPEHLMLPRTDLKKGFMYVYGGHYVGLEPVFMHRLWMSSIFPEIVNDPTFGKDRQGIRKYATYAEKAKKAGLLRLKKVNEGADPHFVVAVPLAEFSRYNVSLYTNMLRAWFTKGQGEMPDDKVAALSDELKNTENGPGLQTRFIPPEKVIAATSFDAKTKMALADTLLGLRLAYSGGAAVVFADFKITKAEAQQLTSTEWMLIRNVDLYPLLLQWQVSLWGYRGNAPTSSFPMSKISKTLPPFHKGQSRVNEFGLSIAADGAPVWLPETLDATTRYEDLYSQIGDKGDDTFSLVDVESAGQAAMEGTELKVHLPKNIPVLIDWVNNRFAFTQGNGVLKVLDLTRYKICDAAHARNLLVNWSVDEKDLKMMVAMGDIAGVTDALFFTEEEMKEIQSQDPVTANRLGNGALPFEEYWKIAINYHENSTGSLNLKYHEISIEGDSIWRPLARYIDQAQSAVLAHMDAVNQKFTVSGTIARLGVMTLIAKYGNEFTNTSAKANTICAAAANQEVDPNWKVPSVPMIMNNPERPFAVLPHQAKVMNLMKDSPDFAILPVQAGGGKTPLAILDVLKEIQANRSNPYLIMCPSPLVAQYVKEVTYFTDGKINVIPIISETLAKHGFERITAMIQSAPRNTVVVVNYDVLRSRAYDVCYGTTNVKVYPVIELLRQFNFGYALLDESHFMKNDSQRTRAAMVLIADIPKKRLASGTMAHDSPSDLALQVAMLDPTLFGSKEQFNARFGADVKGDRVIKWNPGAQVQIMTMIKSRIVVAKAMRKEWAALLPHADEKMYRVDMSEAQKEVYDAILTEELGKLREDAMKGNNKALKKFFENGPKQLENPQHKGDQGLDEEADEEAEDVADEGAGSELEGLLGFALARLEQYMTAPGRDELGARVLKGDDLRSPKVNMILRLIDEHIKSGRPGKVLVFTNYIESAEEIFAAASPELQKEGILYTAANKVEDGAQFETNDRKKWMVGVENSMNTGLNFQFVSHLIRVENVWNPGTLEQGNSRINRPEMKKSADQRPTIYYSWIVTNNSIDVTKVSRLISKMIAVAKFENADNDKYAEVPDVPVIPMSAEAIMESNSWSDLAEYASAFKALNTARDEDYAEYREKHGALVMTPLHAAPTPKDAAIMAEVPYVAGLEVFSGASMGLIRVDEYLRLNANEDQVEGGDDEVDDAAQLTADQRRKLELAESLKGQPIHTEFGDGICKTIAFSSKMLTVLLPTGYSVKVRFASAFVIGPKARKGKIMREQILKAISNDMPIVAPTGVHANRMKVDNQAMRRAEILKKQTELDQKREAVQREVEAALNIELQFNVSNGFLGISYYPGEDDSASAALQALGFRPVEPYVFAEVKNAQQLIKQFNAWHAAGFQFDKQFQKTGAIEAIKDLAAVLKGGSLRNGIMNYKFSSRNQLQNFFKMELKPSANALSFKPYPMIEDGRAYIVMHTRGQPGALKAMQLRSPGIRWQRNAPCMVFYGLSADKISAKMRQVIESGIQISNIKDLQKEFRSLKKQKLRNNEDIES